MLGLQITCAAFKFLIWIAPPEEIRVLTLDLQSILAENHGELWLEPT